MSTKTQRMIRVGSALAEAFDNDLMWWVDLWYKGEGWVSWCCYPKERQAKQVSDHFKGIKLLKGYSMGPCDDYTKVRVRRVSLNVTYS